MDISGFSGTLPDIEKTHQIYVLAVNVTNNLNRWLDLFNNNRLGTHNRSHFISQFDYVLLLAWKLLVPLNFLALFRPKKCLEEQLRKTVIGVLINPVGIFLLRLRVQSFRLFSELVYRDLPYN